MEKTTKNKKTAENKAVEKMEEKNMKKTTTKSIVNVTVNGLSSGECVDKVIQRIETVEKNVFNIALLASYATGVEIPPYTDVKGVERGRAVCENPISQADFVKLVGRSKQSVSRWIKAFNLIIENCCFSVFAEGKLPFSYDKIIFIFEENESLFEKYCLNDLFELSLNSLKSLAKKQTEETEETEEAEETATLTYNGKEYVVNKKAFEKWLTKNGKIA